MANGAPTPTPAADWAPTKTVELPSGKHARLREKLSLRALIRRGEVELEELTAITSGAFADGQRALEIEAALLSEMFVEPALVIGTRKPGKKQIHIDDIEDDDASFVLELALGGAPELATFRGHGSRDGDGADGPDVVEKPKRATRAGAGKSRSVDAGSPARAAAKRSRAKR